MSLIESHSDQKLIYRFGGDLNEGNRTMKDLLGGKGANLAEMSSIGLPVPPGFTISAEVCEIYTKNDKDWPKGLKAQVEKGIDHIEKLTASKLGGYDNPLLISVRSGAAVSMPGMMDTILNLGLNDTTVEALARKTGNRRFALDCYRRFIQMFGNVVMHIPNENFDKVFDEYKSKKSETGEETLTAETLGELVEYYKAIYREKTGYNFIEDPIEQLKFAIHAVFDSWHTPRAKSYRKINNISGVKGTAITVQAMVFGNMGKNSATGVCFTRNPSNGDCHLFGEFLLDAQGEDVVAGNRTPIDIEELNNVMEDQYKELKKISIKLEKHYKNMQDIEFTIQENRLYILQTRNGKRTGQAALKIAIDMVDEGIITKKDALLKMVEPSHIKQLLHPQLNTNKINENEILAKGLASSPGAAVGKVVFTSQKAEEASKNGDCVILVRNETSPEDVSGISVAEGVLTCRGGMTSHASVVARGWGKPCIAGCDEIVINSKNNSFTNGKVIINEGDWITLDGTNGIVILGQKQVVKPTLNNDYHLFMSWVDQYQQMSVRANADTPEDAVRARSYGADGIGLCRTEHMFFKEDRINIIRQMIIAKNIEERDKALKKLLPFQKSDFISIFEAMDGLPVTIRLLDPPLHEFLPDESEEIARLADEMKLTATDLTTKINKLKEINPMLGHRGCRLGITFPEITIMQTRAIIEAAIELRKIGKHVIPEIMIPLIGTSEEFKDQNYHIRETAEKIFKEFDCRIEFKVGAMIEVPRAALIADEIATEADFFSFGTNDLTQMIYGYSRDDSSKFLDSYIEKGILLNDPFKVLDKKGVGKIVALAVENGRKAKPELKIGVCGEHGGEPSSIDFFYNVGLDYISCSPLRVPIARLSAVQAYLKTKDLLVSTN